MLAITGGKGGTGKTTTALGVASLLAQRRRDPVVVDADIEMPNLHLRAGARDDGLERIAAGESLEDAADEAAQYPGVDILGATPGVDLANALRRLGTDRPVILDGAAGASELAVKPLRYADAAVVVTRATPASVTDTMKTVRMARAVGTPIVGTLVSRTSYVSDDVTRRLPTDTIHHVPSVENPVTHESARIAYSRILDTWINA